jgi:hypothetical protein
VAIFIVQTQKALKKAAEAAIKRMNYEMNCSIRRAAGLW